MGATEFEHVVVADTPQQAFAVARDDALYNFGHAGYTGTIAEKSEFTFFQLPEGLTAEKALELLDAYGNKVNNEKFEKDPPIPEEYLPLLKKMWAVYNDKWGPALCLKTTTKSGMLAWLFCGLASS